MTKAKFLHKTINTDGDVVYKEDSDQMRIEDYGIEGCGTEKLCTTGCNRTGCIFCAFGAHLDERGGGKSRFERLKETHILYAI